MRSCILILSYNHPELTARAVQSARVFSEHPLFLIHNGSLPVHVARHKTQFPEIRHLVLESNRYYAGGINFGLNRVFEQGFDWVFVLTNDCVLKSFSQPNGPPALIAPTVYRRKEGFIDSIGAGFDASKGQLWHAKSVEEFLRLTRAPKRFASVFPYVPGSAFWVHRDLFEKTGGFEEKLQIYWDDVDFSIRCFQQGFPLLHDARTQVIHSVSKTTRKDPFATTYLFQRNRRIISKRYVPSGWPQLRLFWHLKVSRIRILLKLLLKKDLQRLLLFLRT